ncbi:MAG: hypothetical protein ACFB16_22975 [Phormidesmis sp.]
MSSAASRPPYTVSTSQSLSTGQLGAESRPSARANTMTSRATGGSASSGGSIASTATDSSVSNSSSNNGSSTNGASNGQLSSNESAKGLRKPPSRSLLKPPARPKPPAPAPAAVEPKPAPPEEPAPPQRPGPISLPSEPMQYRAIGLLKGKYIASEDQFNRGDIQVADGTLVDAVLLGRVTSLIKKHLDLEKDHLWVVYPRTLYKDSEEDKAAGKESEEKTPALHVQIVGVWEPETLNADAMNEEDETRPLSSDEVADQCDHFSVRGEIAKYSEEDSEILVNIVQKSKSETVKPKRPFKLLMKGTLTGRTTGYFWDLTVERQEGELILKEGKAIAVVPPKKKAKGKKSGSRRRPPAGKARSNAPAAPKPKPKAKPAEDSAPVEKSAPVESAPVESASVENVPVESTSPKAVEASVEE